MRAFACNQNEGRQRIALFPFSDNFYEVYKAWKNKKLTQKQAAKACNMAESTFHDKAQKFGKV